MKQHLQRALTFVLLILAQALVLNHIRLFGYVTPLIYTYIIMPIPRDYPKWAILLIGFTMGLCVDIFSNTPGVAASALTLISLIRPYLLEMFMQRESDPSLIPSIKTLGILDYSSYVIILIAVHCLVFFSLEMFTYFNWQQWLKCIGGSSILTFILVLVCDNLRIR